MSEELRNALSELALPDAHPDPERLAAYHSSQAGELSPEEEGRIQDHLALCRECAALLLDLDGLADPGFGAGADPTAKETVWQNLREEIAPPAQVVPLRAACPLVPALAPGARGVPADRHPRPLPLGGLAAPDRRGAFEPPRRTLRCWTSTPARPAARGARRPSSPFLRTSGFFTVILNPAGQRRYERYRVEIVRVGGEEVWSSQGIEPSPFGSFSLTLPRRAVGPGDYRVRLFGRSGETEELIDDYAFRVE